MEKQAEAAAYEQFGRNFMHLVLHKQRVLESIDRILGPSFHLGPIGAGPGRVFATVTANGTFGHTYGEQLAGQVGFRVFVPVDVIFDLDLSVDAMRFHADVIVPLTVTMHLDDPLTIIWRITPPEEHEVTIKVKADNIRSTVLQKAAGIDGELRRFLIRFVTRELAKPHVQKAKRIDVLSLIDNAWPELACQFLPNGPEDRT